MQTVEFTTYFGEDNVLNVIADVTPGRPAKIDCLPEDACPAEAAEVEITDCRLVNKDGSGDGTTFDPIGLTLQKQLTSRDFHNMLRVLLNLDYHDLDKIITRDEWREFRLNPWRWMITADSQSYRKIYDIMIKRARFVPTDLQAEIEEAAIKAAADSYSTAAE